MCVFSLLFFWLIWNTQRHINKQMNNNNATTIHRYTNTYTHTHKGDGFHTLLVSTHTNTNTYTHIHKGGGPHTLPPFVSVCCWKIIGWTILSTYLKPGVVKKRAGRTLLHNAPYLNKESAENGLDHPIGPFVSLFMGPTLTIQTVHTVELIENISITKNQVDWTPGGIISEHICIRTKQDYNTKLETI